MSKNKVKITVYPDAVKVKGKNKMVAVVKKEPKDPLHAANVIFMKSLVAETGPEPGVKSELSKNGKVKHSWIGLSDEAIRELYACLHHYLGNV